MHELDLAGLELGPGLAPADHGDDFELQPLGPIKSGCLGHPDGEKRVRWRRLADLERDQLCGPGARAARNQRGQQQCEA